MSPKDEDELADMLKTSLDLPGPSAIRYPRGAVAGVARKSEPQSLPIGKAEVLFDGSDVAILGLGPMISLAKSLAQLLDRDGYSAAVINPRFIKPLDREVLARYASRVAAFVTFEDHVKMGGFGTAVVEALDEMGLSVPVVRTPRPLRPHRGSSSCPGSTAAHSTPPSHPRRLLSGACRSERG